MKALIVDPDRTSRAVLKRLLSHVNVDCHEAENGLVALNQLEQIDPDFLVLEIEMPILSGPDMLAAVRQSPTRPDVPAIVISTSGTRDHVMRMVGLGVADYLVKPINPVEVLPRIKNLLARAAQWRQRQVSRTINGLLIVDADPNFLAFVKPLLEASFEVHEAPSSTTAAITYRDAPKRPTVICLAEGLPLMNEDLLVDVIRKLAVDEGGTPPQFFLLAASANLSEEKTSRYAGVVRKTFVPQQFMDEFRRVVLREQSSYERLRRLVQDALGTELTSAAQQTVGVMIGSDVQNMPDETPAPYGIVARVDLTGNDGLVLRTELSSGREEVERMGSRIVRRAITFEEGANEVLGELVNTIGGRMRAGLLPRDFDLRMGLPDIRVAEGAPPAAGEYDLTRVFRTADGELFRVSLSVIAGAGTLGIASGSGSAPAAAATAAASVDDVLF